MFSDPLLSYIITSLEMVSTTTSSIRRSTPYNDKGNIMFTKGTDIKRLKCVLSKPVRTFKIDLRIVRFEITLFKVYEFRGLVLTC